MGLFSRGLTADQIKILEHDISIALRYPGIEKDITLHNRMKAVDTLQKNLALLQQVTGQNTISIKSPCNASNIDFYVSTDKEKETISFTNNSGF